MGRLWLDFVMHEKHQKFWNGKDWMKNKLCLFLVVGFLTMVVGCGGPSKGTVKKLFNDDIVAPFQACIDEMIAEGIVEPGYSLPVELLSVDAIGHYDSARRCWPVRLTVRHNQSVINFEVDVCKNSFNEWQMSGTKSWREAPGNKSF